jgi:hypothetical protein
MRSRESWARLGPLCADPRAEACSHVSERVRPSTASPLVRSSSIVSPRLPTA